MGKERAGIEMRELSFDIKQAEVDRLTLLPRAQEFGVEVDIRPFTMRSADKVTRIFLQGYYLGEVGRVRDANRDLKGAVLVRPEFPADMDALLIRALENAVGATKEIDRAMKPARQAQKDLSQTWADSGQGPMFPVLPFRNAEDRLPRALLGAAGLYPGELVLRFKNSGPRLTVTGFSVIGKASSHNKLEATGAGVRQSNLRRGAYRKVSQDALRDILLRGEKNYEENATPRNLDALRERGFFAPMDHESLIATLKDFEHPKDKVSGGEIGDGYRYEIDDAGVLKVFQNGACVVAIEMARLLASRGGLAERALTPLDADLCEGLINAAIIAHAGADPKDFHVRTSDTIRAELSAFDVGYG